MKIAFVLTSADAAAGTERTVINQANELSARHQVSVYSIFRTATAPAFPLRPEVSLHHLIDARSVPPRPLRAGHGYGADELARLASTPSDLVRPEWEKSFTALVDTEAAVAFGELDQDVVVATTPALLALLVRTVPDDQAIVVQEHRPTAERGPTLEPITAFGDQAQAIVSLTARSSDWIADHLGHRVRTQTIANFLPAGFYPRSSTDANLIIAAGRMVGQKRFDHLISAFAPLAEEFRDWRLRIYGEGRDEDKLRRLARRLDVTSQVEFPGVSPTMLTEWARGSIFALSSRHEGFPMVALEASACGLPLVMYDCPTGPAELLGHGGNGILVPNGDVEAFTSALRNLITDRRRRIETGRRAREVARLYSPAAITTRWEEFYADVVSDWAGREHPRRTERAAASPTGSGDAVT